MDITDYESNLEARVAFKRLTGQTIRLTPFQMLTRIGVKSDDEIVVTIVTHTVEERKAEDRLTARGTVLAMWKKTDSTWVEVIRMPTIWDADFKPVGYPHFGPGKTPEEWLRAREYARQCYRPGSSAQPMDSHHRTTMGYTSDRMARHW